MKLYHRILLFALGGGAYLLLELLWRGRSHIAMFFAGGLCFLLIGHLGEVPHPLPLPLRVLAGAGMITALELFIGLLWNRNYEIWDYRGLVPNYHGQICLLYSLLWVPVSFLAIYLYRAAARCLTA